MKIIKWLFFLIVGIYLLGFLLPSKFHFEKSKEIQAKSTTVHALISDLKKWEDWSPWHQIDPNMKLSYEKDGLGVGASYSWSSEDKSVGKGKMTLTDISENSVKSQMDFDDMGTSNISFNLEPQGDKTKVTWNLDSEGKGMPMYFKPISRYMNLMMPKFLGPQFELGLNKLDSLAIATSKANEGKVSSVEEIMAPEMNFIQIESICPISEIGPKLSMLYSQIMEKITENKLAVVGMPMAMYPGIQPTDTVTRIIAMMATDKKCTSSCGPNVSCGNIPARKVLKAVYFGPYEKNIIAYQAIQAMMAEKNLSSAGEPYEEYANDPMEVKDEAKFQTNVYWPIK